MEPERTEFECVRAWAEWDLWTGLLVFHADPVAFDVWLLPKTGKGDPWTHARSGLLPQALPDWDYLVPLRSLRVLLRSGHVVRIGPEGWGMVDGPVNNPDTMHCAHGKLHGTFDTEAVTRALTEAQHWLTARREADAHDD